MIRKTSILLCTLLTAILIPAKSQNPLITNIYTADPAAHQFSDGKLYLYADHDPNHRNDGWLQMYDYHVYSTSDLITWTDHGSVLNCKEISWNDGPAWDGDCVEANGKYYYYFPMVDKIGVAVSEKPTGPFKDALGKPLITRETPGVKKTALGWLTSPCVLFYNDTAYVYLGQNDEFYLVKLNKNMLELDGPVHTLKQPKYFHEAVWVNYANGKFHATYGGNDGIGKDKLAYATADNPYGPFIFQYFIQNDQAATVQNCVTNFNGRNLFFYHRNGLDEFHRQICLEEFQYTNEGLIPKIPRAYDKSKKPRMLIDALGNFEAEDCQETSGGGIERIYEFTGEGNLVINVLWTNSWIKYENVDFGEGVKTFEAQISAPNPIENGIIELRCDSINGKLIGKCIIPKTNGWFNWTKISCSISPDVANIHDLYLVFRGDTKKGFYYQVNYIVDNFRFSR